MIGAPLLILWALAVRTMSGMRVVTVGFVTVNPDDLVDYVKHLALGLAIVASIAIMFSGPTAVQH